MNTTPMPIYNSRIWLGLEALLLLGGMPLLILGLRERGVMLALLWGGALATWLYLRRVRDEGARLDISGMKAHLKPILIRFVVLAPVIAVITWMVMPQEFLSFPRQAPERWLMVMLLYPLLSVWPQEIIYRGFMHERYKDLWGEGCGFVAASALAFGYMHLIFLNAPAVILTMILGLILARDYARHRSIALVCVEHALYGCLIFSVGLGTFFYSGAAWN